MISATSFGSSSKQQENRFAERANSPTSQPTLRRMRMCDYSLMNFPNRLAEEGEILVTQQFSTGSIGFVCLEDSRMQRAPSGETQGRFWSRLITWFSTRSLNGTVPAVCIPPGAKLRLRWASEPTQTFLGARTGDSLTFTQISAASNQFRDAFRTQSGREILLQNVGIGLQVEVVNLSLAEEREHHAEFVYSLVPEHVRR